MATRKVMVVEDDSDILDNMTMILESEGYETIQASNGQIALNQLKLLSKNDQPNCIILDLMMPVMDGRVFMETLIREHPEDLAKIPIIIATAKGSAGEEAVKVPRVVDRIKKPFDLKEFIKVVARHC